MERDKIVEAVREDLLQRSERGIQKYGTTLDREDLTHRDWLQHAYEEALDLANYLKKCILDLDSKDIYELPKTKVDPKQQKINFDEGEE